MNEIQQETETFRTAFAQRSQRIDPSKCPLPEVVFDAASGTLQRAELNSVIDHVSECARCTESWRLARAMTPPSAASGDRKPPLLIGLAAAATVILSASVFISTQQTENPLPSYRGSQQVAAISSATPQAMPQSAFTLRWTSNQAWPSYSIHLMNSELETIWMENDIEAQSVTVPAALLPTTNQSTELYWQVEAWRDGVRRELSPVFKVTLDSTPQLAP